MARSLRPRRLPPDLAWWVVDVYGKDYGMRSLEVDGPDGLRVAYVRERACRDGWAATIRRHLDWPGQRSRVAPSQEIAMKWAEWWAVPRMAELREAACQRAERNRGSWGVSYPTDWPAPDR